jgi:hypothetical protein
MKASVAFVLCFFAFEAIEARKLLVGPGKTYALPSLAAAMAQNNDTVEISMGVYENDAAAWSADNLVIRGTGRFAHLKSNGAHSGGKGIWVIGGKNTTVENMEFSGAKVPDQNGAGIRQEGPGLILKNCFFHDNENGILTGGNGDILIENCEFSHNGLGDGFTHNMYIGKEASFTLKYSYSHHAKIGHNVKSRALKNYILYNRIMDEVDGTGSYAIDLPNGGFALILGNFLQQGPLTDNPSILAYGAEGLSNPIKELYIVNNTFVNDRQGGTFINIAGTPTIAKLYNNLFVGDGTVLSGKADSMGNVATNSPDFVDRKGFDYRLTSGSIAIDKGKDPGMAGTLNLAPTFQYVHPVSQETRSAVGSIDAGAYEFGMINSLKHGIQFHGRSGKNGIARVSSKSGLATGYYLRFGTAEPRIHTFLGRCVVHTSKPSKITAFF